MGILITIEGGEYTGKTTIVLPGLAFILKQAKVPVLVSREPGGSPEAERIRYDIFQKKKEGAPVEEITELFFQARVLHLEQTILPFLGKKKEKYGIVILDRYIDSTRVYQGCEAGVPMDAIHALEKKYIHNYFPDITFLLTLPEKQFSQYLCARKRLAQKERYPHEITGWDTTSIEKHKQRQSYIRKLPQIAQQQKEERVFVRVDTSEHPHSIIKNVVQELISFMRSYQHYTGYKAHIPLISQALQSFPSTQMGKEMEYKWEQQIKEISR